jgi:uncharacterized protein (TIGR00255 family)
MVRSMTGYGQGTVDAGRFRVNVEIRSLNSRFADLKLRIPPSLFSREAEIRNRVLAKMRRGRIDVDLRLENLSGADAVALNRSLAEAVVSGSRVLREEFGADGHLDLRSFMLVPGLFQPVQGSGDLTDEERGGVLDALDRALEALDGERRREGEALRADLLDRLRVLEAAAGEIRELAARVPAAAQQKLLDRMRVLLNGATVDPGRVAQEAAFLADKCDITEELVRLLGHLDYAKKLLATPDGQPVGKRLDFLFQEIQRETNTIGAKSADLEITRAVLRLKTEAEKVREQIQNLE